MKTEDIEKVKYELPRTASFKVRCKAVTIIEELQAEVKELKRLDDLEETP